MWWEHRVYGRQEENERKGRVRWGNVLCWTEQCGLYSVSEVENYSCNLV